VKASRTNQELVWRLESALRRSAYEREYDKSGIGLDNVKCEVCGDNIPVYIGPPEGIVCSQCAEPSIDVIGCTRISPLVIIKQ